MKRKKRRYGQGESEEEEEEEEEDIEQEGGWAAGERTGGVASKVISGVSRAGRVRIQKRRFEQVE